MARSTITLQSQARVFSAAGQALQNVIAAKARTARPLDQARAICQALVDLQPDEMIAASKMVRDELKS